MAIGSYIRFLRLLFRAPFIALTPVALAIGLALLHISLCKARFPM